MIFQPVDNDSDQPVSKVASPRPLQPFPINFANNPSPINTLNTIALQIPQLPLSPLANISEVPSLSLMCPFCDQELPGTAFSDSLMKILDKINIHGGTKRDPTPENPNHLTAVKGLTASVAFCAQHRHEKQLQVALDRGWPTRPDFIDLPDRVIGLTNEIKDLVVAGILSVQSPHQVRINEHLERARMNVTISNFGGSVSCG